jgi:hypothetical protein
LKKEIEEEEDIRRWKDSLYPLIGRNNIMKKVMYKQSPSKFQ